MSSNSVSGWSLMGIRSESKQKTHDLILRKTALLLDKRGFLNVSSKRIAKECNVSQGSIFLHFKSKENLLNTILLTNIVNLETKLKDSLLPELKCDTFLKKYLDIIIVNESFLSRAYMDLPYLPEKLSKNLISLETTTKNLFFENIRYNKKNKFSIVDSFISIDAFFSQIQKNLLEKEKFTKSNSILRERRGKILKLYKILFE
jgi:AcrR family transcriptional regulator